MGTGFRYLKRVEERDPNGKDIQYDLYLALDGRPDHIGRFQAEWLRDLILEIGPEKITTDSIISHWITHDV